MSVSWGFDIGVSLLGTNGKNGALVWGVVIFGVAIAGDIT